MHIIQIDSKFTSSDICTFRYRDQVLSKLDKQYVYVRKYIFS